MASLYDSESITCASGTRRGSADSTPSTSVQIWICAASSSAPKIEAEKSLPLRPSVVCTPRGSLAMKPVITSVTGACAGSSACSLSLDSCHCTAGPSGPHSTVTQRRASSHCTPPRIAAALQVAAKQPRRPDLAVARTQVAHRLGGRAHDARGLQHAGQIGDIAIEFGQILGGRALIEQGRGDARVPLAQRREPLPPVGILALGQRHQLEQRVGDAFAGRQHDRQPRPVSAIPRCRRRARNSARRRRWSRQTYAPPRPGGRWSSRGFRGHLRLLAIATKKLWHTTSAYPIPAISQIAHRDRPPQGRIGHSSTSHQWKAPADALADSLVPGCAGAARAAGMHAVHQHLPHLRQFLGRARAYRRRPGADRSRRVSIRQPASAAGAAGGRDRPVPGRRAHPRRADADRRGPGPRSAVQLAGQLRHHPDAGAPRHAAVSAAAAGSLLALGAALVRRARRPADAGVPGQHAGDPGARRGGRARRAGHRHDHADAVPAAALVRVPDP